MPRTSVVSLLAGSMCLSCPAIPGITKDTETLGMFTKIAHLTQTALQASHGSVVLGRRMLSAGSCHLFLSLPQVRQRTANKFCRQ